MYQAPPPRKRPDREHSHKDLTLHVRRGDIYFFTAISAGTSGKINTVAYCPTDDATLCDCYAAEYGRACWHTRHVKTAWLVLMTRKELAGYGNAELGRMEREAAMLLNAGIDAEKNAAIQAAVADEWADRLLRFVRPGPEPTTPATPAALAITPRDALAPTGTEGYRREPPPPSSWRGGTNIDANVCGIVACASCGHHGLDYAPFFRAAPRSYRAFGLPGLRPRHQVLTYCSRRRSTAADTGRARPAAARRPRPSPHRR